MPLNKVAQDAVPANSGMVLAVARVDLWRFGNRPYGSQERRPALPSLISPQQAQGINNIRKTLRSQSLPEYYHVQGSVLLCSLR